MSVYSNYRLSGEDINCPICLDPNSSEDWVAHAGIGYKHPIHRNCAKEVAIAGNIICPSCQVTTDTESLYTWKDKVVIVLKDAISGGVFGSALPIYYAVFYTNFAGMTYLLPEAPIQSVEFASSCVAITAFLASGVAIDKFVVNSHILYGSVFGISKALLSNAEPRDGIHSTIAFIAQTSLACIGGGSVGGIISGIVTRNGSRVFTTIRGFH